MKIFLALVLTFIVCLIILSVLPVHGESEIYESVLRLHVIANSDSEEDQALKLKVRDAILKESGELFSSARSKEEAIEAVKKNSSALYAAAYSVIREEGYEYTVRIEIGDEEYPTKNYESFSFPSGTYASLRVKIGDAEGQNWWCVLYPPLCLSAATGKREVEDGFISVGLTDEQYRIITETDDAKYQLRFKFLELFSSLGG